MSKVFQVDTGGTLTTGLISYWKLSDLTDFYSTNDLTNINSATFVTGKIGNALQPAITGAKYLSKSGVISTVRNNFSVSAWVYLATSTTRGGVFHNGSANGWGFGVGIGYLQATCGNRIVSYVGGSAFNIHQTFIGTGWHHLVLTMDSTTWRAYVDGAETATTFTGVPAIPTTTTYIGALKPSSALENSDCTTDEIGVWEKCLTQQEITDLYNSGNGNTMTNTPADVTTGAATSVSFTTATLNGTVHANDNSTVVTFEYGTTISYGTSVTAAESPVTGSTSTAVSKALTGLIDGTVYHFRAVGVNSVSTVNGSDATFTTLPRDSNAMFMTNENVVATSKITADTIDSNAKFME